MVALGWFAWSMLLFQCIHAAIIVAKTETNVLEHHVIYIVVFVVPTIIIFKLLITLNGGM